MLDYLLARPQTKDGTSMRDALRYLVVDELHTMVQGTDLACLIRRLKNRLNSPKGHACCVGTSATLGDENRRILYLSSAGETFPRRHHFRIALNTYEFVKGSIIGHEPSLQDRTFPNSPDAYTDSQEYLHQQMNVWFGRILPEVQCHELKTLGLFRNILEFLSKSPLSLKEAVQQCFSRYTPYSEELRRAMIISLLSLAAYARSPYAENEERKKEREAKGLPPNLGPIVQVQVQLWQRELRRIVANVSETPELVFHDDLTIKEKRHHLPVIRCRDCGLMGWATVYNKDKPSDYNCNLKNFYQLFFSQDPRIRYLFPAGEDIFKRRGRYQKNLMLHKSNLQHDSTAEEDNSDYVALETGAHTLERKGELKLDKRCPRCDGHDSMFLVGFQAATLTATYINQLFSSPFNSDKKLLTFSDSVQDAAHRAGFFEARTWRFNLRMAIQKTLTLFDKPPSLQELATKVIDHWRTEMGDDVFVATFIPPNMVWMDDYEKLLKHGSLPPKSDIIDWISHRLRWEINAEYSFRAKIGRSLPSVGSSVAAIPTHVIDSITETALPALREIHSSVADLRADQLRPFVQGFVSHLIRQGSIFQHGIADQYFDSLGRDSYMTFSHGSKFWMPDWFRGQGMPIFLSNKSSSYFDYIPSGTENTWLRLWIDKALKDRLVNHETKDGRVELRLIGKSPKMFSMKSYVPWRATTLSNKKATKVTLSGGSISITFTSPRCPIGLQP